LRFNPEKFDQLRWVNDNPLLGLAPNCGGAKGQKAGARQRSAV